MISSDISSDDHTNHDDNHLHNLSSGVESPPLQSQRPSFDTEAASHKLAIEQWLAKRDLLRGCEVVFAVEWNAAAAAAGVVGAEAFDGVELVLTLEGRFHRVMNDSADETLRREFTRFTRTIGLHSEQLTPEYIALLPIHRLRV